MTDYLCIRFPPVQSVCKLTLTFPDTFIIQSYLVTNFGGTAHLRRLHFSLLISEKWAAFLMALNSFHPKVWRGPVSCQRCFMEAVWWNTEGPSSQVPRAEPLHCCLLCFSPWTWHPRQYAKPDDIPECLPTDTYRFWVNAGSPRSSVCGITACFYTNAWWGHTFRPPVWQHWGQNSFQSGEIEQKSIWPYSETKERRGWAGQEPTCA